MKRLTFVSVLAFASAVGAPAQAGILELYGQLQGGGGYGQGLAGAQKDADFFNQVAGGIYGAKIGAEVLFIDAFIEHDQYTDLEGLTGTWTQFMLGFDFDFALGATAPGKKPKTFGEVGLAVGYGVGTGQQVEPPLDNAQVSDKGFLGQLHFGAEYRFNRVMSLGLAIPVQYGYLFKNGIANDEENQYQSLHASALAFFKLRLGFE